MSSALATLFGAAASTYGQLATFVPLLAAAIAYFQYEMMDPESRPIDVSPEIMFDEYDFIIVGAGSAGKH